MTFEITYRAVFTGAINVNVVTPWEAYDWLEWAEDEWKGMMWVSGGTRLRAVAAWLACDKPPEVEAHCLWLEWAEKEGGKGQ